MAEETKETKKFANAQEEIDAIELAIKKAQLEDIQLQRQEREYSLKDLKQRLGEREVKELQKKEDREAQGRTFATQRATDENRQAICTHKKGGVVSPRDFKVLNTGGNGQQYAIIKHQMINGDLWVRCLRCGKTWVPPVKENFYFDTIKDREGNKVLGKKKMPATGPDAGTFSKERYDFAWSEYRQATAFETNNSMSGSVQCKFTKYNEATGEWVDASLDYRQQMVNTNLR